MTAFNTFLNTLDIDHAKAWDQADEQFLHIANHAFMGEMVTRQDGSTNVARVELVEKRLQDILDQSRSLAEQANAKMKFHAQTLGYSSVLLAFQSLINDFPGNVKSVVLFGDSEGSITFMDDSIIRILPAHSLINDSCDVYGIVLNKYVSVKKSDLSKVQKGCPRDHGDHICQNCGQ